MTDIEKRARVEEWRISRNFGMLKIRYWIERDPEHGGMLDYQSTYKAVEAAEKIVVEEYSGPSWKPMVFADISNRLLELLLGANSVEVCDLDGNGITIHRDWP